MSTSSASLVLIRHLKTDTSASSDDGNPPLSAAGRQQAAKLIDALRTRRIAQVYSSDLRRAQETAETIAKAFGVPLKLCSEFRELLPASYEALRAREQVISAALDDILHRHSNSTIAIVAHSGTIRAIVRHLLQLPLGTYEVPSLANGGWLALRKNASGVWNSAG